MRDLVLWSWLVLVAGTAASACLGPRTPGGILSKRADPRTLSLFDAAGEQAAVVVILHPGRWLAAARTLRSCLSGLEARLDLALQAADLPRAVACLAGRCAGLAARLKGWDADRPIVAGLFAPRLNDLVLAVRGAIPGPSALQKLGVPGIAHRVLVPATDPQALILALADLLRDLDLAAVEDPARFKQAQVFELPLRDGFVALRTHGERGQDAYVRLDILTGEDSNYPDDQARRRAWAAMLSEPDLARSPVTPARIAAVSRPDFMLVHVRPWLFRDLAARAKTRTLLEALAAPGPSKTSRFTREMARVATGDLLMDPALAEVDDFTLGFDLDEGLRLTGVVSLTESGRRIVKAGLDRGSPRLRMEAQACAVELRSRLDIKAVFRAAAVPPELAKVAKLTELMSECGVSCRLNLLTRMPFGLARTLADLVPEERIGKMRTMVSGVCIRPGSEVLGELRINPSLVAKQLGPAGASILNRLGSVRGRMRLSGNMVFSEILVDLKDAVLGFQEPLQLTGLSWDSPGVVAAGTKGAGCMRQVTRKMIQGLKAPATTAPGQHTRQVHGLSKEIEAPLLCARQDPQTQEAASRTQLWLALHVAERYAKEFEHDGQRLVLVQACRQGHAEACERVDRLDDRPPIQLVRVQPGCSLLPIGGHQVVQVPARDQALDLQALDEALSPGEPMPALAIGRHTRYDRLVEIIRRLAAGQGQAQVLVHNDGFGNQALLVDLQVGHQLAPGEQPIVLQVSGKDIVLTTEGRVVAFKATHRPREEVSAPNLDDLKRALQALRERPGRQSRTYLDAESRTTFSEIAEVLATASCSTRQSRQADWKSPPLVLGPVPDAVMDRAKVAVD